MVTPTAVTVNTWLRWRRNIIPSAMAVAIVFYLAFLSSVMSPSSTPATSSTMPVAHEEGRSMAKADTSLMVDEIDIEMAEFAYNEQKGERNPKAPVSEPFAKYGANWPCFWGETAVGDLNTWKTQWSTIKDGWKYVCGLSYIREPCVVYSLGSNGNMAFEKELLKKGTVFSQCSFSHNINSI